MIITVLSGDVFLSDKAIMHHFVSPVNAQKEILFEVTRKAAPVHFLVFLKFERAGRGKLGKWSSAHGARRSVIPCPTGLNF